MSEGTKIQWCDDTHNFWQGCTKVSSGCTHCYAEARDQRFSGGAHWGKGAPRVRSKDFEAPLKWNEKPWVCGSCGTSSATADYCQSQGLSCEHTGFHRRRVFALSLGDWLDEEVPIEWLADMLDVIRRCPNLHFLMLTKRPENWRKRMELASANEGQKAFERFRADLFNWIEIWLSGIAPTNIWIGATVENQEYADKRIPELLKIPAVCRFVSYEPALGPVDFSQVKEAQFTVINALTGEGIRAEYAPTWVDWIIVGGESGPKARPFNIEWARSTVAQCQAAWVACFVKQLGACPTDRNDAGFEGETETEWPQGSEISDINKADTMVYQGKLMRIHLRDKKGGDMAEWPVDLQRREFPTLTAVKLSEANE